MQVVTPLLAIASIVIAAVSATNAHKSRKRADEALDHQKRLDEREREFRDVQWRPSFFTGPDAPVSFVLRNDGLTDACGVTVVVHDAPPGVTTVRRCDRLAPGESVSVELDYTAAQRDKLRIGTTPHHVVHWSSPLGHPEQIDVPLLQLF